MIILFILFIIVIIVTIATIVNIVIIVIIIVIIIEIIIITQDESVESTTVNLSAIYDIMFMEPCQFEQYSEELEECNT